MTVRRVKSGSQRDGSNRRIESWRRHGEVAAGRGWALRCCGAGLRSRLENWEEGGLRSSEGRRGRGAGLEA